ncbi:MAG: arsenite methyltransferase [Planctomycetes bacterium]|nr:arsenite methyltransferase [Planctomycetota bacterium]
MSTKTNDAIRSSVSNAYAKAVSRAVRECGCCTTMEADSAENQTANKYYNDHDLTRLPEDAIRHSLGCGNPLAYVDVKEGDVVLDLGSGAGIDILLAAERVGPSGRVIGIDMTDEMLAKAQENIEQSGFNNVQVRKGLIEDMPIENDSIDWVISNCVINLSPEKDRVFGEIARVLKPGGKMLVSDIVVENLPQALRNNDFLYCGCVAGAIREAAYIAGLQDAGLTNVVVKQRVLYDSQSIEQAVERELEAMTEQSSDCCGSQDSIEAHELAELVVGGIWSCQFSAKKV